MDDTLSPLRNEVLRRIGRNVWIFQGIEVLLKQLVHWSDGAIPRPPSAHNGTLPVPLSVRRATLGTLAGQLFHGMLGGPATPAASVDWFAWKVRLEIDPLFSDALRKQLAALVDERNLLVHHAIERWDLTSEASLQSALPELDAQRERTLAAREILLRFTETVRTASLQMLAYFQSAEGRSAFYTKHLEACLLDAVARAACADGWAPLSLVGQHFQAHVRSLTPVEKKAAPKLKSLLVASGLFDVRDEVTPRGGRRTLCRLRDTPVPPTS